MSRSNAIPPKHREPMTTRRALRHQPVRAMNAHWNGGAPTPRDPAAGVEGTTPQNGVDIALPLRIESGDPIVCRTRDTPRARGRSAYPNSTVKQNAAGAPRRQYNQRELITKLEESADVRKQPHASARRRQTTGVPTAPKPPRRRSCAQPGTRRARRCSSRAGIDAINDHRFAHTPVKKMLDVCQGANQKLLELTTPLLSLFAPLSLMVRGKRDAAPVCKTIDAMDEAGHRSGVGAGQRRKDTDTASTTPESNSVNADCGSTDAWSHSARVTDLKDVKGAKRAPWDTPAWTATLSDMTTNSGTQCSSDDVGTEASQMAPDGKYHKSESDDRGAELPGILGASKYKRSNSFAGAASYGGATQAATTAENSWEADSSYHGAASDGGDVLRRFMADLRRKRMANAKYPSDTASYTNNRFAYVRGPLGFPTVFRDTETREVVRSECSTLPLTVFSEFTPSHLEDNAVAVQPSDKVDIIARHNRWLYVRVARSSNAESVGSVGWIPEEALLEPEIFSRRLFHSASRTHTFNKFL